MPSEFEIQDLIIPKRMQAFGKSALVKLISTGFGKSSRLNLAVVVDVSGSMYLEDDIGVSRLQRAKEAATAACQKLNHDDTLAVVAYAHDARTLVPATKLSEKSNIQDVIDRIDLFDVDAAGSSMAEGMKLGLEEVEKERGKGCLSKVFVLSDGDTIGEETCHQLALEAALKGIHVCFVRFVGY